MTDAVCPRPSLACLAAMAAHFEMEACQKDASLLAFVRSLHHETTRVASDFLAAESAAADKTKQLTVLAEALRNQNEALIEQTALLSKLVQGEREPKEQQLLTPDSPRPVRGHRRVFSQDAMDELRQQQEARRALLEDWEVDEKEFTSFLAWRGANFPPSHPFLADIIAAEVEPCLDFGPEAVGQSRVLLAEIRRSGGVALEPLRPQDCKGACALCPQLPAAFKLTGSEGLVLNVGSMVRHRVAAVCELFHFANFLRAQPPHDTSHKALFCKLQRLRLAIATARLGLNSIEE